MGDITIQKTDAIVNPSSTTLLEGGMIDSSIREICGEELTRECKKLNGCPIGQAKVTDAHNMMAKKIIHTASPIWRGGYFGEDKLLRKSYINSLNLALENNLKSISIPSISTGTHNFPLDKAASIAISAIYSFLDEYGDRIERVNIVCYDSKTYESYRNSIVSFETNTTKESSVAS